MKPLFCHRYFYQITKIRLLRNFILVYILQNFLISNVQSQCTTISQYEGNSFVDDNSSGAVTFNNPSNAKIADGTHAVASVTLSILGTSSTHYLKATNFGFAVPTIANICGITVEVRKRGTGINILNIITDKTVRLIVGGAITGNNKAASSDWPGSDTYKTYGASNDLWGAAASLTPASVNSSNFGVAFAATFTGVLGVFLEAEIDQIRVTVDYSIPLPITLLDFNYKKKGDNVTLAWLTAEEEDKGLITLQRSYNNEPWTNLNDYELSYSTVKKYYQYDDLLQKKGNYSYRLKMITAGGKESFSSIRQVSKNDTGSFSAYPNPAKNTITVDLTDLSQVQVLNLNNQVMKVPAEKTNKGIVFNLENLAKGLYIIKSKFQSIMFFKDDN